MIEFIYYWIPALRSIAAYINLGGPIVLAILIMASFLWFLAVERFYYIRVIHPQRVSETIEFWKQRADHSSWYAHKIRDKIISEVEIALRDKMEYVFAIVMIAPLAGLVGTVRGMIKIFQTLSFVGSTDVRQMASGVYEAIIPTLTGMSVAVIGLLVSGWLRHRMDYEIEVLEDKLEIKRIPKDKRKRRK